MANIGPIPVPDKIAPYLKFAVALASVVATAIVATVAGPPAWVYIVIAVAGAFGVERMPNITSNAKLLNAAARWGNGVEASGIGSGGTGKVGWKEASGIGSGGTGKVGWNPDTVKHPDDCAAVELVKPVDPQPPVAPPVVPPDRPGANDPPLTS